MKHGDLSRSSLILTKARFNTPAKSLETFHYFRLTHRRQFNPFDSPETIHPPPFSRLVFAWPVSQGFNRTAAEEETMIFPPNIIRHTWRYMVDCLGDTTLRQLDAIRYLTDVRFRKCCADGKLAVVSCSYLSNVHQPSVMLPIAYERKLNLRSTSSPTLRERGRRITHVM